MTLDNGLFGQPFAWVGVFMPKNNRFRGIHIRIVSIVMLCIAFVLFALTIIGIFDFAYKYKKHITTSDNCALAERAIDELKNGSLYLTEQVRLYVLSEQVEYLSLYFEESDVKQHREKAMETLTSILDEPEINVLWLADSALKKSNDLMKTEIHAMKLLAIANNVSKNILPKSLLDFELSAEDLQLSDAKKRERAKLLIFNGGYRNSSRQIISQLARASELIKNYALNQKNESRENFNKSLLVMGIYIVLLVCLIVGLFLFIDFLVLKPIRSYIKSIQADDFLEEIGPAEFRYFASAFNEIFRLNRQKRIKLQHLADHDSLTGILNRGAYEKISNMLEKSDKPLALLLVDVDHFKYINDTFGHKTGDIALKEVAENLSHNFNFTSCEYAFRYGGDEFAILVSGVSPDDRDLIRKKIEDLNEKLQNPKRKNLPPFSVSCGVAFSSHGFYDALFSNADKALYFTKNNGRCGCTFFEAGEK